MRREKDNGEREKGGGEAGRRRKGVGNREGRR